MINNNVSIHKLEEMGRRGNYVEEVKRIFNSFFQRNQLIIYGKMLSSILIMTL